MNDFNTGDNSPDSLSHTGGISGVSYAIMCMENLPVQKNCLKIVSGFIAPWKDNGKKTFNFLC